MRKVLKYNLKALMADKGVSVNEVANLCRKSRQTVSNWINADINSDLEIKFSHLQNIAQLLEVEVNDLIKKPVAA
jgi:transcriptional regulator with XRE-family HTH domain